MKSILRILPLLVVIMVISGMSVKAQEGKGTLRGKVINKQNEPVVGANVFVKETSEGVATDVEGRFELELKPGTYTLRISYVAFTNTTIQDVKVKAGEVNYLGNIEMSKDSNSLEGVVISADRIKNSEKAMLSMKANSPEMIDGISAETFSKTGDGDAAAAMKRVTGVSVQDGKYVHVRGLGGRYTQTTLNDVAVPGLDPNRNAIQMDLFPTNILSNIVVSKNFTADQPANFSGGLVNIETRAFPTEKTLNVSVGVGYNPSMHFQNNFLSYDGGGTDFLGMNDGTRDIPTENTSDIPFQADALGNQQARDKFTNILGSFNKQLGVERQESFMDYDFGISGGDQFELGDYTAGYNFAVTYKNKREFYESAEFNAFGKPDDPSEFELERREGQEGAYGKKTATVGALGGFAIKSEKSKYELNFLRLQSGTKKAGLYDYRNRDEGANFDAIQNNLTYRERAMNNILLAGNHYLADGEWELNWELSPTFSSLEDPDVRFSRVRVQQSGPDQEPRYSVGSEAGKPRRIWRFMDQENYFGKFDAKYNYELFGRDAHLKSGVAYTYKQRDYSINDFNINPQQTSIQGPDPNQIMADSNLWSIDNTSGTIYSPTFVDGKGNRNNRNKYSSNVHKPAAYLSTNVNPMPDLSVILGLRAEQYQQAYSDFETNDEEVLNDFDLFPSLNLNYSLSDEQNLRFSYSRTIARPSFREISRVTIFDPISGRFFLGGLEPFTDNQGNTTWDGDLEATRIQNFDLRWEWFQPRGQMISISAFYKTFDDPIETVQLIQGENNLQPRNVGDGRLAGIEVEIRQSLGRVHRKLKALSVDANFTYTQSQIDISSNELRTRRQSAREGKNVNETRPMTRQAPWVVNAGLSYKSPNGSLQVGSYYNVKGRTLYLVGVADRPDVYRAPFHNLKMNATYNFGEKDRFSLSLEVENLLDDNRKKYFDAFHAKNQIFSQISPSRTFSLGFGVNF